MVEAERGRRHGLRPGRILDRAARPSSSPASMRASRTGRAGRRPGRLGEALPRLRRRATRAASRSRRRATRVARSRIAAPRLPDRRRSASSTPRECAAQNPRAVAAPGGTHVVDALGEDRFEVGALGAVPLPAERTAALGEGVGEVDVGAGAHGKPGHAPMVAGSLDPCRTVWYRVPQDLPAVFPAPRDREDLHAAVPIHLPAGADPLATRPHRRPVPAPRVARRARAPALAASARRSWSSSDPSAAAPPTTRPTRTQIVAEARRYTSERREALHAERDVGRGSRRRRRARPCSCTWATATAGRASTRPFQTRHQGRPRASIRRRRRPHEDRLLRRGLHPRRTSGSRPNAVVLLYHLCYASGNTEPGTRGRDVRRCPAARRQLRGGVHRRRRPRRVRRGSPGPSGHRLHPPAVHDQPDDGPGLPRGADAATATSWARTRPSATPGLRFEMDPDTATPSGFYRSVVGDLGLTATRRHRHRASSGPGPSRPTSSSRAPPR